MASTFILVNRRLNTPGVVVARCREVISHVELFFKDENTVNNETKIRITQESTGLSITIYPHDKFKFTLSPHDALWAASTNDVICWQLWS